MHRSVITGAVVGTLLAILATLIVARDTPGSRSAPQEAGRALACLAPSPSGATAVPRVDAVGADLPGSLRAAVERAAALTHGRWQQWLGDDGLAPAPVNLIFMGDEHHFAEVYEGPAVDGWTTTGFYRSRSHEAVILYSRPYRRDALATTLHELAHLQTAWHLGPRTPPWLNEGLAEYLEMLDVPASRSAEGGAVDSWRFRRNPAHLALLETAGVVDLRTLIALAPQRFARRDAPRRYASAWALVAFLNHSDAGRVVFTTLLADAHGRRCDALGDATTLLATYPGGLDALERDWRAWIGGMTGT